MFNVDYQFRIYVLMYIILNVDGKQNVVSVIVDKIWGCEAKKNVCFAENHARIQIKVMSVII